MAISELPILDAAHPMQWHQERQRLLAENVANADTPNFRPRDLAPLKPRTSRGSVVMAPPPPLAMVSPAPRISALGGGGDPASSDRATAGLRERGPPATRSTSKTR